MASSSVMKAARYFIESSRKTRFTFHYHTAALQLWQCSKLVLISAFLW
jgi:hypothetical protein